MYGIASIGTFYPQHPGIMRTVQTATYTFNSGNATDIQHAGANNYFVMEDTDGAFLLTRAVMVRWSKRGLFFLRVLRTLGFTSPRGVWFDSMTPLIMYQPITLSWEKLTRTGTVVDNDTGYSTTQDAVHDGMMYRHADQAAFGVESIKRQSGTNVTVHFVSSGLALTSVTFDGRCYWGVDGSDNVYQIHRDGTLMHTFLERTAFKPTSITFNGRFFIMVNGVP